MKQTINSEAKGVEEFSRALLKDGFFCLFFTLWAPVPSSSLCCDVSFLLCFDQNVAPRKGTFYTILLVLHV